MLLEERTVLGECQVEYLRDRNEACLIILPTFCINFILSIFIETGDSRTSERPEFSYCLINIMYSVYIAILEHGIQFCRNESHGSKVMQKL